MAMCDYLWCAKCGCKAIYDAELDYESATGEYGSLYDIAALCKKCSKTHSLKLVDEPTENRLADFLDTTEEQPH